jgi:hypothetical protein
MSFRDVKRLEDLIASDVLAGGGAPAVSWLRTSATGVSRHRQQICRSCSCMSKARLASPPCSSSCRKPPRSPPPTESTAPGSTNCRPATTPKARPRSSHGRGVRTPHLRPLAPAAVELIWRLRKELAEKHLDAGADTIGWHLHHHHGATVSRAIINRCLRDAGLVTPEPKNNPSRPTSASRPSCPTSAGGPTSPNTR